jgi:hypothetical protein
MGRRRHDDFDSIDFLEACERREQVPMIRLDEIGLRLLVEIRPRDGGDPTLFIARGLELSTVRFRAARPLFQVREESLAKPWGRKHLGEDGRDADRDRSRTTLLLEAIEDPEEREITLGRRFIEPRLAVRPPAVAEDPWQVRVKHEEDVTERRGRHRPLHGGQGKNPS